MSAYDSYTLSILLDVTYHSEMHHVEARSLDRGLVELVVGCPWEAPMDISPLDEAEGQAHNP